MTQKDSITLTAQEFERLMMTISDGWNKGDARKPRIASAKMQFMLNRPTNNSIMAVLNSTSFSVESRAQTFL